MLTVKGLLPAGHRGQVRRQRVVHDQPQVVSCLVEHGAEQPKGAWTGNSQRDWTGFSNCLAKSQTNLVEDLEGGRCI